MLSDNDYVCINRIRLEFKDDCLRTGIWVEFVLIESDWNLKRLGYCNANTLIAVLIESDWNLKKM